MELEANDEGFLEVQRSHELSTLPKQSVCNTQIKTAHDIHKLAGIIAIAFFDNLGYSPVLYNYDDVEFNYCRPVLNSENDRAEQ